MLGLTELPIKTVIDVGANVGDWTEPLVLHPSFERSPVRVHAFEPVPSTRASFTKRIHNKRVRVHALALSDRDGEAKMSPATAASANPGPT